MNTGIRFYDVHCHAMNLSHPNFLLFVKRMLCAGTRSIDDWKVFLHLVNLARQKPGRNCRILNLVSVMERDCSELLKLMENDLKILREENKLHVERQNIGSVVLTPLMVDFGRKDLDGSTYPGIYYNTLSRKPIRDQVDDLFDGIRDFRKSAGPERFLEVFPFLGLNTANYSLESSENSIGLRQLLHKYFSEFTKGEGDQRRRDLSNSSGTFSEEGEGLSYSCTGIKVYPPLGFDPWPEAGAGWKKGERAEARKKRGQEQEKVEYLYRFCADRDIPITAHCNDGGFMSGKVPLEKFTAPAQWRHVVERFPKLKLNLAHFGRQDRWCSQLKHYAGLETSWQEEIVELLLDKDKHVYSDFSFIGASAAWYKELRKLLDKYKHDPESTARLRSRILFGSDFMINLLATESYKRYVEQFLGTGKLYEEEKSAFCSTNPEGFLFGTT